VDYVSGAGLTMKPESISSSISEIPKEGMGGWARNINKWIVGYLRELKDPETAVNKLQELDGIGVSGRGRLNSLQESRDRSGTG
jgi:hypothetical protein